MSENPYKAAIAGSEIQIIDAVAKGEVDVAIVWGPRAYRVIETYLVFEPSWYPRP